MDTFFGVNVREVVVSLSVASFVCSYGQDHIPKRSVRRHIIVLDCLIGGPHQRELRQLTLVDILEKYCISVNRLLLEVAHEPVAELRGDKVHQEIDVRKRDLGCRDEKLEEISRFSEMNEEEQMHSFVLCLLEQMVNPTMISLAFPQASEMTVHTTNHAWDAGNRLEENHSIEPASLSHLIGIVARKEINSRATKNDGILSDRIGPTSWCAIGGGNPLDIGL